MVYSVVGADEAQSDEFRRSRRSILLRIMGIFGKEDPEEVTVNGKPLRCVVCQHGAFYQRRAQLHGPVATLFNLEWTAPTATCVICSQCGHVHWFLQS